MKRFYQFLGSILLTSLMAFAMEALAQVYPTQQLSIGAADVDGTSTAAYSIVSNDIDSTCIASAYQEHSFELESEYTTTGNWTFLLPNTENEYVQISYKNNSKTFTIEPISNKDQYQKDSNGNIVGIVKCSAYNNGVEYNAEYSVTFELRPVITNIVIKQIIPQSNGQMSDIYFDVYYAGTDRLEMSIEREYSVATRNSFIDEPSIAHIKATNIYNSVYSWIRIIASNEYGTAVKTLEVSPEGNVATLDGDITKIQNSRIFADAEITVVSPSGNVLYRGHDLNEFKKSHTGLYLIISKDKNGKTRSKKCFF